MNSQSIEFQKIKNDVVVNESIRDSFRIPVEEIHNSIIVINEIQYSVFDISPGGIGFGLKDNSQFSIDEIIENCELNIFDQSFKNLKVKIVHFSKGTTMPLQCGIKWVDLDNQTSDQLNKIVLKMKDQLFL
ncbi:PilZ domain-containing protein [bacterium]|nr:PilZ domain-containing protein [bacterium]